jgi:hypothetical protein
MLEKVKYKTTQKFDTYIINKGFCFDKISTENAMGDFYRYKTCTYINTDANGLKTPNFS